MERTSNTLTQEGRYITISPEPSFTIRRAIEGELTYVKKGAEFMANPEWAKVRLYNRNKCKFPIGLLPRVEKILHDCYFLYDRKVIGYPIMNLIPKDEGLYEFQKQALRMFLNERGGIFQIPTGGGKTRTAIACIKTLNVPTLVVVPTKDLKDQWEKQIDKTITVSTYQSLKSKAFIQQFDLVVFDECHNVAAKSLQKIGLNLKPSAITLGLSATPFMRDDDNLKVESALGPIIYKISLRELINAGYLVDAKVLVYPTENTNTDFMDYNMTYREHILENIRRNGQVVKIARESKGYILILVKMIEHGEQLLKYLKFYDEDVVFLHGKSSMKDRVDTKHRILIATSIFDEGIDIPHLKHLILAGGGKSAIKATQRIGRVLRKFEGKEKAIVHDFDDNCRWLSEHTNERLKIYMRDFEVIFVDEHRKEV